MTDTAYKSTHPDVLTAWDRFVAASEKVREARDAVSARIGRGLMVNRLGFGHGTRVVGFERYEDDEDGALLADGALRVPSSRNRGGSTVGPNLRRKAGKELAEELARLASPNLDLPGMPAFHIAGAGDGLGLRSMAPALWRDGDTVYALWGTSTAPVGEEWEEIPLSVYYAAKEAHDAAEAREQASA